MRPSATRRRADAALGGPGPGGQHLSGYCGTPVGDRDEPHGLRVDVRHDDWATSGSPGTRMGTDESPPP